MSWPYFCWHSICRHPGSIIALLVSCYTVKVSPPTLALSPNARADTVSLTFHTGKRDTAGEAGVPLRVPGRDAQGVAERVLSLLAPEVRQVRHEVQASLAYQEPEGIPFLPVFARSVPSRFSAVRVVVGWLPARTCQREFDFAACGDAFSRSWLFVLLAYASFHVLLRVCTFCWHNNPTPRSLSALNPLLKRLQHHSQG